MLGIALEDVMRIERKENWLIDLRFNYWDVEAIQKILQQLYSP